MRNRHVECAATKIVHTPFRMCIVVGLRSICAPNAGFRAQVTGWELREDEQKRLRLRRRLVAKNFKAGLELCERIGELAEAGDTIPTCISR